MFSLKIRTKIPAFVGITKRKAFTLAELVVVISILSILSVVAFVSYSGYLLDANDSARKSDMGNLKVLLKVTKQRHGAYPYPTGSVTSMVRSTQSNLVVAKQGWVLQDMGIDDMGTVPSDPKNGHAYLYSTTRSGNSYQVGSILESKSPTPSAYVDGDYSGIWTQLPGILFATGATTLDLDSATNFEILILDGSIKNLPYDTNGSAFIHDVSVTTLSGALFGTSYVTNSNYSDCQSVHEAGRSFGSGDYWLRDSNGTLAGSGCAMAY